MLAKSRGKPRSPKYKMYENVQIHYTYKNVHIKKVLKVCQNMNV